MGGELGNETYIDLLVSSALSTKFHLDRKRQFLYECSVKKLVFLGFRGYLGEIESVTKKCWNFSYTFFFAQSVVSGLVLPIFVAQFAVVHEIRL